MKLDDIIARFGDLIAALLPVAAGFAILFFFWGLALFIWHSGNEAKRKEGQAIMIWGTLALFVLFSIWGIVLLLQSVFGVSGISKPPTFPQL